MSQQFGGNELTMELDSRLPWEGKMSAKVKGNDTKCRLAFRIPSWSRQTVATISKDGETKKLYLDRKCNLSNDTDNATVINGYLYLEDVWNEAEISFDYDMKVTLLRANNRVREDVGKLAVRRGPITYCLEEKDNGKNLQLIHLDRARYEDQGAEVKLVEGLDPNMLEVILPGIKEKIDEEGELYMAAFDERAFERTDLHLIPYYAWNNRGVGEMSVFFRG